MRLRKRHSVGEKKFVASFFLKKILIFAGEKLKKPKVMVMVRCECGAEILLLPDVKKMSEAIEVHVALHLKGVQGQPCTALEAERLRDALIIEVLRLASESEEEEENSK